MTKYAVKIADVADGDVENVWRYIAYELDAAASADKVVDGLYAAIEKLDVMPKRFRVVGREPWKSRGVRFMSVGNYRVHYVVDDLSRTVTVLRVMYFREDS